MIVEKILTIELCFEMSAKHWNPKVIFWDKIKCYKSKIMKFSLVIFFLIYLIRFWFWHVSFFLSSFQVPVLFLWFILVCFLSHKSLVSLIKGAGSGMRGSRVCVSFAWVVPFSLSSLFANDFFFLLYFVFWKKQFAISLIMLPILNSSSTKWLNLCPSEGVFMTQV